MYVCMYTCTHFTTSFKGTLYKIVHAYNAWSMPIAMYYRFVGFFGNMDTMIP